MPDTVYALFFLFALAFFDWKMIPSTYNFLLSKRWPEAVMCFVGLLITNPAVLYFCYQVFSGQKVS
jgi:hypothetical protein